jgi:hypothetical protein
MEKLEAKNYRTSVSVFTTAVATTTVTLGSAAQKRAIAIEERATAPNPSVPAALKIFADNLISSACSCLSIPTLTVRSTTTSTSTTTVPGSTVTITATGYTTSTSTTTIAGSTITDTTVTETTTTSSVSTSFVTATTTVLGVASQCAGAQISASPVNLVNVGNEAIAGTAEEVGPAYPANNVQDCCSNCYLADSSCVGFYFGNFDDQQTQYPPVLSGTTSCRIYVDVFSDCSADIAVFNTGEPPLTGEVNYFGIGPCTPTLE